jgi:hypothetical protein
MRAPTGAHLNNHDEDWWSIAAEPLPESIAAQDVPRLNIALRYLWAELRQAQSEFADGVQLNGAYSSLVAAIAFLSLFGPVRGEGLFVPLAALESALWALGEGVVEPIFKPPQPAKTGRARSPDLHQQLKGATAYVVRRLCDLGHARSEAWKVVAADLRHIGVKPDRGTGHVTARTVRGWCEEVAADIGCHGTAAKRYHQLLAHPANKVPDRISPEEAKSWLRSRLRLFATAVVGKPAKPPA